MTWSISAQMAAVYGLAGAEITGIAGREMVVFVVEVRHRGLEQSDLQIYLFCSVSLMEVAQICVCRATPIWSALHSHALWPFW